MTQEPDGYYGEEEIGTEDLDLSFLDENETGEPTADETPVK
jgi:hypothetical protein